MSELKKLTRLGSDTKKIAALLQAKAPKGHMLAYINPREAALLKEHGGSGKPHADTGILSFEDGMDAEPGFETFQPTGDTVVETPAPAMDFSFSAAPQIAAGDYFAQPSVGTSGNIGQDIALSSFPQPVEGLPTPTQVTLPAGVIPPELTGLPEAAKPEKPLLSEDTLKRLGLAGGLGLLGQRQAARAGQIGQKGAQQIQQLAAPYQQKGQQIQAQAQRGELTPAAQQSLQAMQARAAQAAESRGGVGAAQAQQQIEAFRQQLLQQQYDYGLKLSGIGDNIALGAIKTGLQADQYVNQLTNNFYTNMAYIASGMAPAARTGGAA